MALCAFMAVCAPRTAQAAVDVGTSASFAVAIDAQTGRILYEKNAHGRHSMASTTKIMTAIVALEHGNLDDVVTVSPAAAATEGSSMYLSPGEKITLGNLLYGLMLPSGNDAAMAIGEHVGGDIPGFAAMMNETAQKIGAVNTQFQNPSGLDAEGHYSTAYDMAIITRYAMKNPAFAEIVQTKKKMVPWEGKQWDRTLENHNKLLSMYEGCIGVKTGYTKKTGRCLVSAAQRGGMTVICVTLADPNDWAGPRRHLRRSFFVI